MPFEHIWSIKALLRWQGMYTTIFILDLLPPSYIQWLVKMKTHVEIRLPLCCNVMHEFCNSSNKFFGYIFIKSTITVKGHNPSTSWQLTAYCACETQLARCYLGCSRVGWTLLYKQSACRSTSDHSAMVQPIRSPYIEWKTRKNVCHSPIWLHAACFTPNESRLRSLCTLLKYAYYRITADIGNQTQYLSDRSSNTNP